METVTPDDGVSEMLGGLARADVDGFPIVEDDVLVGIVLARTGCVRSVTNGAWPSTDGPATGD